MVPSASAGEAPRIVTCTRRYVAIRLRDVNVALLSPRYERQVRMPRPTAKAHMHFKAIPQTDVPQGRNGKHKTIVTQILSDLDQVPRGVALKIPLATLTDAKENVRSALNRATRKY